MRGAGEAPPIDQRLSDTAPIPLRTAGGSNLLGGGSPGMVLHLERHPIFARYSSNLSLQLHSSLPAMLFNKSVFSWLKNAKCET